MSYNLFKLRCLLLVLLGISSMPAQASGRTNPTRDGGYGNFGNGNCGNNGCSDRCSDRYSNDCSYSCNDSCSYSCSDSCSERSHSGRRDCDSFSCSPCSFSLDSCRSNSCHECSNLVNDCDPRTTFIPRSLAYDSTYELALNNYFIYHNDAACRPWAYFFATPFYQQSRRGREFGRFFLPNTTRDGLIVAEDGSGDFNSLQAGIIAPVGQSFKSRVDLYFKRRVFGAYLYAWTDLSSCFCEGLWASLAFVPVRVENSLCTREIIATGTDGKEILGTLPGLADFTESLANGPAKFGRIVPAKIVRSGVDDIQLKIGSDVYQTECMRGTPYFVLGIPTGRPLSGQFLWEPVIGPAGHASLGFGFDGEYNLYNYCDHNFTLLADFKYRYVFAANEFRTFDFCCNGPLSRFLLTTNNDNRCAGQPAINLFSQCVRVEPRSTIDLWAALHWEWCRFNAEFGYELFYRDSERIYRIQNCGDNKNVSFYDLGGVCRGPVSSSTITIAESIATAPSDSTFTPVTSADLNLYSSAQPRVITHKIYGALSYNFCLCDAPALVGVGGQYEFARHNRGRGALEQYGVWAKLGIGY